MIEATTIGIDIAKSVFQIHGVNAVGKVVVAKRLTRGKILAFFEKLPPCLVGIVATALVASIAGAKTFSSGRNMAAWIGLVPKQHSIGGKQRLGGVSKQGNRYLRWLLVTGAMAVIRYAKQHGFKKHPWLARLMERKPTRVAAVALANKIARMAWVVMARGERYTEPALLAG